MSILELVGTSILTFLLGAVFTFFATRWTNVFLKIDSLEIGVRALLRDSMIQMHQYYKTEKIPVPQREIDNFESMYEAYKKLGGNGYVDDIRHVIVEVMEHEDT